jgi:hypothetical protein
MEIDRRDFGPTETVTKSKLKATELNRMELKGSGRRLPIGANVTLRSERKKNGNAQAETNTY